MKVGGRCKLPTRQQWPAFFLYMLLRLGSHLTSKNLHPWKNPNKKLSSKLTWQWKAPSLKWQRDVHSWLCLSICHVNLEGGYLLVKWYMRLVANFATLCLQPTWKAVVKMGIFPNQGWLWTYLKPTLLISPLWRKPPLRNCSHGHRICERFTWRPQKFMHLGWGEQSLCHYIL